MFDEYVQNLFLAKNCMQMCVLCKIFKLFLKHDWKHLCFSAAQRKKGANQKIGQDFDFL